MAEGLEVVIKYCGTKYDRVASPVTPSSAFAILKRDLAHLRVHSPSRKNVRRVDGSFMLHWPAARTNSNVEGLPDTLYTRWVKLCSEDPEAFKLRDFLSIESITLTQDGVLIGSTAGAEQPSQEASLLVERLNNRSPEVAQKPAPSPVSAPSSSLQPQLLPPPPPKLPPSGPRYERHPLLRTMKRRMSAVDGPSSPTRQKLDAPELQPTAPLRSIDTQVHLPRLLKTDRQRGPSTPRDATKPFFSQLTQDDSTSSVHAHAPALPIPPEPQTIPPSPPREPGVMTSHTPLPILVSGPSPSGLGPPPPHPHHSTLSTSTPTSPYLSSTSSGNSDPHASHQRDYDVSQLTRELWDTRRQLTVMQAREQVILSDLERFGARPESTSSGAARNAVSQDDLLRLEAELKTERMRRVRAEQTLSDVERECKAPFVVPALFQAFMNISELSS